MNWRLAVCVLLSAACGCSGRGGYLVSPSLRTASGVRVAVLPFDNQSTAADAAAIMRRLAAEVLGKRGYLPLPGGEVDAALLSLGVPAGGRPGEVRAEDLGRAAGADLLCYGDVKDFTFQSQVSLVRKSVVLRLKLVSASTGETLYEGTGSGRDVKVYPGPAEARAAYLEQLSGKQAGEPLKTPLRREAETAAAEALDRLPRRAGK